MSGIRVKVKDGRLLLDEPTHLPEGTVLDLVVDDEGDDLTREERHALNDAISRAWDSAGAGRLKAAKAIVDELRARSK
ncbi:MAG: hypothetical protein ACRD3V_03750 [Vicinamibacteria bacterium]